MPIQPLPTLLISQIAAGEVIERPASVVKELIENSIDAHATQIDILIHQGGQQLIRIRDNGQGIPDDQLHLALAPHATSKLQSADQLTSIQTLGFRGEALASIASVSRLKLISRPHQNNHAPHPGAILESSAHQLSPVKPHPTSPGTTIEIRDLFFNTPARQKFLRAPSTEFAHISDTIQRIALAHPHVGFSLQHNDRLSFDFPPTSSHRQRCLDVLGKELDQALLEFQDSKPLPPSPLLPPPADSSSPAPTLSVWGLAGLPASARATSKFQYLYVNQRPIRDRNLAHAIKEAYRGLIMPDLHPLAVIFLQMPPQYVDVNVHPAKAEVRFRDPNLLHSFLLSSIRQKLLSCDLTPQAQIPASTNKSHLSFSSSAVTPSYPPSTLTPSTPASNTSATSFSSSSSTSFPSSYFSSSSPQPLPANTSDFSIDAFIDYFKRMAPPQQSQIHHQIQQTLASSDSVSSNQPTLPHSASHTQPLAPQPILQVHQSYVVTQDDQGLLIIDQHALHERIMFEELSKRILSGKLESQRLLIPVILNLSPTHLALAEQLQPLFDRIGIELQPIGPNALALHAFPSFLFDRNVDPHDFLSHLLDRASEGDFDAHPSSPQALEAALHQVLDMMACKAAVKAGDKLSPQELSALLQQRHEIERSSSCPHGRPTTIRLSLHDLEKQFKRIV